MSLVGSRQLLHAHHGRHVRAVDIGVQQAHPRPDLRQHDGHIDRHRALAHAALAGGDRNGIADGQLQQAARAAVARHIGVQLDLHLAHPGTASTAWRASRSICERSGQAGVVNIDGETDFLAFDFQILDHVEGHQVAVQLRFLHLAQRRQDMRPVIFCS